MTVVNEYYTMTSYLHKHCISTQSQYLQPYYNFQLEIKVSEG